MQDIEHYEMSTLGEFASWQWCCMSMLNSVGHEVSKTSYFVGAAAVEVHQVVSLSGYCGCVAWVCGIHGAKSKVGWMISAQETPACQKMLWVARGWMASHTPPEAKCVRHAASSSRCHSISALHALTEGRVLHAPTLGCHCTARWTTADAAPWLCE